MATALQIATKFTAVDKFSPAVQKMSRSTQKFAQTASVSFSRVQRAERRLRKGISKTLGKLGMLGVGLSALTIGRDIANANIQLEKSLKSLSAITGVTGDNFKAFEKQIDIVSKKQKVFAGETAKAFEVVGSAQPELLKNASGLAAVTDAAITLSKASGDELAVSAQALTGVLNQFGLSVESSARAMNVLASASVVGDTKISQTAEAFKIAGADAKMSNISIEELSGSIATLSKFGFKGSEAGTKLRNVFSKLSQGEALPKAALDRLQAAGVNIDLISDKTVPYIERLQELSKISDNSAALTKLFGAENKAAGAILLNNISLLEKNIKGVTETSAASDMAAIKTNTLANRWKELTAQFRNAVTTTNSQSKAFDILKKAMVFVTQNMDTIIKVVTTLIAIFATYKFVMFSITAAMRAYTVITKAVTAAQWLWNVALSANPIGLVVIAIIALIAVVAVVIKKYDEWGAALTLVMGPLGMIINLIQAFRRNWDMITKAFKEGGVLEGFKAIGATILDAIIMPLHQFLKLISKIPRVGKYIKPIAGQIADFRDKIGVVNSEESADTETALNPQAEQNKVTQTVLNKVKSDATLNINDNANVAELVENNGMNINLTKTFAF